MVNVKFVGHGNFNDIALMVLTYKLVIKEFKKKIVLKSRLI